MTVSSSPLSGSLLEPKISNSPVRQNVTTSRDLARYIEYLKEENKILRARIPGQIHTKAEERKRLLTLGKALGKAIEELISIVTPSTSYRWVRDESDEPRKRNPKGGSRKSWELRELVIEIARQTGFA